MTNSTLSSIAEQLRDKAKALTARQGEVAEELSGIKAELTQVTRAIAALDGKKSEEKNGATRDDVAEAVVAVLSEERVVKRNSLRKKVSTKLGVLGKTRRGFSRLLDEVLAENRFVETPEGYRLVDSQSDESGPRVATGTFAAGG